jgi:hypothetical protein
MEMARRFVLVGLFVVIKPGTVTQLFLGSTCCAAYLMIQLQVASTHRSAANERGAACAQTVAGASV